MQLLRTTSGSSKENCVFVMPRNHKRSFRESPHPTDLATQKQTWKIFFHPVFFAHRTRGETPRDQKGWSMVRSKVFVFFVSRFVAKATNERINWSPVEPESCESVSGLKWTESIQISNERGCTLPKFNNSPLKLWWERKTIRSFSPFGVKGLYFQGGIPSRGLTCPPKMAFWRWFSFSQGGIC